MQDYIENALVKTLHRLLHVIRAEGFAHSLEHLSLLSCIIKCVVSMQGLAFELLRYPT